MAEEQTQAPRFSAEFCCMDPGVFLNWFLWEMREVPGMVLLWVSAGCPPSHAATGSAVSTQLTVLFPGGTDWGEGEGWQVRLQCACVPSSPQLSSAVQLDVHYSSPEMSLSAEADGALGQTLPLPKHQSVWPRSKAGSSLRPGWEERQGCAQLCSPSEPAFTTPTTAMLLHTIAKKTCKNRRLETCPWGRWFSSASLTPEKTLTRASLQKKPQPKLNNTETRRQPVSYN